MINLMAVIITLIIVGLLFALADYLGLAKECSCCKEYSRLLYSCEDCIPDNKEYTCPHCDRKYILQHEGISQLGGVWKWRRKTA